RQIGGSVGLAVADTVFASTFTNKLPGALQSRGVPAAVVQQMVAQGQALTGVAGSAGQAVPPQLRPLLPQTMAGVEDAVAAAGAQRDGYAVDHEVVVARIAPGSALGVEVGDVGLPGPVRALLLSRRGLVVEAFVDHGLTAPCLERTVQADVEDVRPALEDEDG